MAFRHPQFAPWRAQAAPLADELGDRELAVRLGAELSELANRTGAPTAIAQALRVHGRLHGDLDGVDHIGPDDGRNPRSP